MRPRIMPTILFAFLLGVVSCSGNKKPVDAEGIVTRKVVHFYNFQDPTAIGVMSVTHEDRAAIESVIKKGAGLKEIGPVPYEKLTFSPDGQRVTYLNTIGIEEVYVATDKTPEVVAEEQTRQSQTPASEIEHHTIFITTATYGGNLGGLEGADALCVQQASLGSNAPSIEGTRWRAILSDGTRNVKDRISLTAGLPVKNTNGETVVGVAHSFNLWNGTVENMVHYDQSGNHMGGIGKPVWTGSTVTGTVSAETCLNWNAAAGSTGNIGLSNFASPGWIFDNTSRTCGSQAHLYCINSRN